MMRHRYTRAAVLLGLLIWATACTARVAQAATLNEQVGTVLAEAGLSIAGLGAAGGVIKALYLLRAGAVRNGREAAMLGVDIVLGMGCGTGAFFAAHALGAGVMTICGAILAAGFLGSAVLERVIGPWLDAAGERIASALRGGRAP